jgi:glycerol uptake facilitator protein
VFGRDPCAGDLGEVIDQSSGIDDGFAGHAAERRCRPLEVGGLEGEECLAKRTGVGGDDKADFGHLSASVGSGFVVHDDHVIEQQDAGADGRAGPSGQFFCPFQGAAAELEAVEIDAAEPQYRGTEHVAQRPRFLFDHAVNGERAHDAVHSGVGQVEPGRQVAEAQSAGSLEGEQDANRSVNALDHVSAFLERSLDSTVPREYCRQAFDNVEYSSDYPSVHTMIGGIMDENTRPQKLAAEVLGTALLVFIGVGAVPATLIVNGDAPFTMADLGVISFAFGTVVIATVYALGHVSGNHINPAVTLGLAVTGKFPWKEVPGYLAAQVVGATIGALAIVGVLGSQAHEVGLGVASFNESLGVGNLQGFCAEFIGTFVLVFVIFGVIHRKAAPGFAGVAIGLVVFAAIIPVAPATSAAINPARVIGPMFVLQGFGGDVRWAQLPVYLAAELSAGVVAAAVYTVIARTKLDRTLDLATDNYIPDSLLAESAA